MELALDEGDLSRAGYNFGWWLLEEADAPMAWYERRFGRDRSLLEATYAFWREAEPADVTCGNWYAHMEADARLIAATALYHLDRPAEFVATLSPDRWWNSDALYEGWNSEQHRARVRRYYRASPMALLGQDQ